MIDYGFRFQWKLPRDFAQLIDGIAIQWLQVYSHILIAKSRICIQLKQYSSARNLLQTVDAVTKDIAYKLSKFLRWELVKVDLLMEMGSADSSLATSNVRKSARFCISSLLVKNGLNRRTALSYKCVLSLWQQVACFVCRDSPALRYHRSCSCLHVQQKRISIFRILRPKQKRLRQGNIKICTH